MFNNFDTTGSLGNFLPGGQEELLPDKTIRLACVETLAQMHHWFTGPEEWVGFVDRMVEYVKDGNVAKSR